MCVCVCVCVVCDVGMEMDVLPKLHDRLWLLVATTHTPPPQVNEAFAAQWRRIWDWTEPRPTSMVEPLPWAIHWPLGLA